MGWFICLLPKSHNKNKKEKSLKMKRDVGMACQKVHKQGRIDKSDGKYTKPHPSLHLFKKEQRCRDEALYIYHHFYPSLFVYVLAHHSYISSFLMIIAQPRMRMIPILLSYYKNTSTKILVVCKLHQYDQIRNATK